MAIKRAKRIELSRFDANWTNSFVMLNVLATEELLKYQSTIEKLNKKDDKGDVQDAKGLIKAIVEKIEDCFVDGIIYDYDLKADRPLVREDIKTFDLEIITYFISCLTGGNLEDF